MANEQQWLAFRVGEQTYGLAISAVREIVRTPELTPVPQSPAYVRGVMNLRGHIVPVIDLGTKLGTRVSPAKASGGPRPLPADRHLKPDTRQQRVLIMTVDGKLTGLLVDEASKVLKIAPSDIESSPKLFDDESESYVTGIAQHHGNLVVLLDAGKLLRSNVEEPALA